ncbi:hypothetical protein ATCC90586_003068 [Pythium insidiosum]|nr:hypothetical protein ATCC90586_003068 [Pythium insidiosum]
MVGFCISGLLNPTQGDEPNSATDEPVEDDGALVVAKPPPKKRGRKPFLPKMNNSERGKYYRAKRKVYSKDLSKDIDVLRSTIARLETLRGICSELAVCPRHTLSGSLVKLVREYFAQFRYGVQLPPTKRNMALSDVETSTTQQEAFMLATMDPELRFGEFKGIHVVMDQWERYSKFHAFLHFELLDVRIATTDASGYVVETTAHLRTRYSRRTIENVFPHVVGNEELTQRLIGREIVYPCRNQFYFTREGRVQRYDVEADFPEALLMALGNMQDVAVLLGEALIRQQHMMGELSSDELAILENVERVSHERPPVSERMEVEYLLSDDSEASA